MTRCAVNGETKYYVTASVTELLLQDGRLKNKSCVVVIKSSQIMDRYKCKHLHC